MGPFGKRRRVAGAAIVVTVAMALMGCTGNPAARNGGASAGVPSPHESGKTSVPTPSPSAGGGQATSGPSSTEPGDAVTSPGQGASVNVRLANARYDAAQSAIIVTAMVIDRISSTGTCALQASSGSTSLSAEAGSVADATVTYCQPLIVAVPPGSAGTWTVAVTFADGQYHGSTTGAVAVP